MSDAKNQHLPVDDENSAECTEASASEKSLADEITVGSSKEESSVGAVGGGGEDSSAGAFGDGGREESSAGAPCDSSKEESSTGAPCDGSKEESSAGAVGGEEESIASGSLPKPMVFLGIEDVQQAFLANAKNTLSQFQSIKDELLETIEELKLTARRNPGNWEIFERLREHLNEAYECLEEIKEAIIVNESREQYLNSQIHQFFEMRREAGKNFEGSSFYVGSVEGFDIAIQTANRSPSAAEENIDRGKLATAFVNQMLQAARLKRRMREMGAETKEVAAAVGMEAAGRDAEEPSGAEGVAERANAAEEREDDGRLRYPPVTGKYTLAIKAHHLYPEPPSSDDSPESESTPQHEGAVEGAPQLLQVRDDVVEEVPDEKSQDNSSTDSPNKESRQH